MIIIIDEASAKLASFYYHDEILKLQWKRAANMSFASDELHDEFQEKLQEKLPDELREKLYVALPANESINDFQKTTIQEYADNTAKANTGNLRIPKAPADYIWIISNRQQKQIAMQWKALQSLILSIWSGCAGDIITSRGTSARQTGV